MITRTFFLLLLLPATATAARQPPVSTAGLAQGPYSTMEMLYERTIFQVDVLRLDLRFGEPTARQFEQLVQGGDDGVPADAVADAALDAQDVLIKTEFLRDISLDRFLEGLRTNLRHARQADLLSQPEMDTVMASVRREYSALEGRGIREGDVMWYRVDGDSLHVVLQSEQGETLVEATPVGEERRLAVLGGYFAPASDYREKLARSVGPDEGTE